jgi:hypothetical protein
VRLFREPSLGGKEGQPCLIWKRSDKFIDSNVTIQCKILLTLLALVQDLMPQQPQNTQSWDEAITATTDGSPEPGGTNLLP